MDKQQRKKVGILGGTFDPIHTGHLILAESAYEAFSLDYVLIMPNGNPPHKPGQVNASVEQRTRMAELAVADNPHLKVSDFEKTPQDYHYTYETLEFLTAANPDTDYYFILGADSLVLFDTWMKPQRICDHCRILAATRDRMETQELQERMAELKQKYGAQIYPMETPNIDISSNMIRERISMGKSVKYYVPASVEDYIREHGLYGKEDSDEKL
jgi:nicotinate-nucleotide adenylyltransferase